MGIIYKATNKVNKKIYIGKTIYSLEERKKAHILCSKDPIYVFHKAIRKYGENNFIWEIIYSGKDSELDDKECYFIKKYCSYIRYGKGYNMTFGGDGFKGIVSEETKTLLKQRGLMSWAKDDKRKKETSLRMKKQWSQPEYKQRVSLSMIEAQKREDVKLNKAEATRKTWENIVVRTKRINGIKNSWEKNREKMIESQKQGWTKEKRKRQSEILTNSYKDKRLREKQSEKGGKWYMVIKEDKKIVVKNLTKWCKNVGFKWDTFRCYINKNKPYKGYYVYRLGDYHD